MNFLSGTKISGTKISGNKAITVASTTLLILRLNTSLAFAVNPAIENACTEDYLTYCQKFDPDGREVRMCMRQHGLKLSQGCFAALVAAGEVSKSEIQQRKSASAK